MPDRLRHLLSAPARRVERDVLRLPLEGGRSVEIERVRDPRARRIRLSVGDRGARLTLPARASLVSGERFVHEHREWLLEQLANRVDPDIRPLADGRTSSLPLRLSSTVFKRKVEDLISVVGGQYNNSDGEIDVTFNWITFYFRYNTTDTYFGTTNVTLDVTGESPLITKKRVVLKNDYIHHVVDIYHV